MTIYTYNVRGIAENHRLYQLLMELDNIDWHIVGVNETHIKGENLLKLKVSNHLFYYKGRVDKHFSGVGFLVNNNIAGNVISFDSISDRIAWITVRLSKRYTLKVIQVYAPTSKCYGQEIEEFYDDSTKMYLGKHGIGQTNERCDMIVIFSERYGLKILNTLFQIQKGSPQYRFVFWEYWVSLGRHKQ